MYRFPLIVAATFLLSSGVANATITPAADGSIAGSATLTHQVTHVPASVLNGVGTTGVLPQVLFPITKLTGSPLQVGGKPDVLAEIESWCPHCAAESWGLAIALSRFGTLAGLREIDSGTLFGTMFHGNPPYPHTKGLSFYRATYTSPYLSFTPIILQSVLAQNLQKPTAAQAAAVSVFDPKGSVPALDVGGVFGFVGSSYLPGVIAGLSWTQIAAALATPSSTVALHIDGEANLLSAAFCRVTMGQPATVCSSAGVMAAASRLPS